jgi:serine/threonine-protein kinase
MAAIAADRHLLFGLLALHNGLINQAQLVAAFQAWTLDKARDLAAHLIGLGHLNEAQRAAVEVMADLHVAKHGDVEQSLGVIPAGRSTRESLAQLGDPEIGATLGHVGSNHGSTDDGDADRTASYAMGTATSDGQRFRILRPHARGGLGAVFVALDTELHREVALKQILDHHADDPTSRQRFLIEAEITGGLEHPGIVPVYGLGSYGDGRPYYAMRFVRGDSLNEAMEQFHADAALKTDPGRRSLELRKLLRRFLDVCNAIGYAHSRGVLHRDIKPSNVIVGQHGETLVVDWGLAKALGRSDPGSVERTLRPSSASGSVETLPGSALGTPAYMSPEQGEGELERLGPRSDVYSLGATLYCLLTGRPPYTGDDVGAILRAVQLGEFRPPRAIDPSIDRALETVCLKAMALKSEDRYVSPRALAEDVERWMADEPVSAWREPRMRSLIRWLTRHRVGVTAAAAAMLVALVGTGAVLGIQTKANAALQRANTDLAVANARVSRANADLKAANERERQRFDLALDAIRLFHGEVSEDLLLKEKQFDKLRTKLLRGAAEFYGKMKAVLERQTDRPSRAALARAYEELGELTSKIGDKPAALALYREALTARRALASGTGADPENQLDVARCLVAVGKIHEVTGGASEARAAYQEACDLAESLKARTSSSAQVLAVEASGQGALGWMLLRTGKSAEALAAYKKELANWQRLERDHPGDVTYRSGVATTRGHIAELLAQTGRHTEALAEYNESLAIRRRIADANPDVAQYQCDLANSHTGLGLLLSRIGKSDQELAAYERSLAIQQKLANTYPAVTRFQSDMGWSLNNIGAVYHETGRNTESLATHRRALEIRRKLVAANPQDTNFRRELASSHHNIANVLFDTNQLNEAITAHSEAAAILERLAAANPEITQFRADLAGNLHSLGACHSNLGNNAASLAAHQRAVGLWRGLSGAHPDVTDFQADLANALNDLGNLRLRTGQASEALAAYREARALWDTLLKSDPSVTEYRSGLGVILGNTGIVLAMIGREADALVVLEEAHRIADAVWQADPDNPQQRMRFAWRCLDLGYRLLLAGRAQESAPQLKRAETMMQALVHEQPDNSLYRYELALTCRSGADLCARKGRRSEAEALLEEGLALGDRLTSEYPENPDYCEVAAALAIDLGMLKSRGGDRGESLRLFRSALLALGRLAEPGPESHYQKARARAQLALAGAARPSSLADAGLEPAASQLDAAIDSLRRATAAAYRDHPGIAQDRALDPLRSRDDFRFLMMDVAMPTEPFARAE